jgi:hypothetical protein
MLAHVFSLFGKMKRKIDRLTTGLDWSGPAFSSMAGWIFLSSIHRAAISGVVNGGKPKFPENPAALPTRQEVAREA